MKTSCFGVIVMGVSLAVGGLLFAGDDEKTLAIKKDRKIYEGTWRVVSLVVNGQPADLDGKKITVVNHLDGTWSLHENGKDISKGPSQIDPTQRLKTIDFAPSEGAGRGKTFLGIYEIDEKTRKLCFVESGKDRPTDFSSESGSERVFVVLERVKAE